MSSHYPQYQSSSGHGTPHVSGRVHSQPQQQAGSVQPIISSQVQPSYSPGYGSPTQVTAYGGDSGWQQSPPSGVSPPPAYSSPPLQVQIPQPYITPSPPSQDSNIKPHYSPPSNPRQQSQQYPPPPFPPTHARTVPPVLPIHSNTPQIAISPSSQGSIHPQQPPHHSQVQPLVSPSQPQLQPQPHAGGNRFPPPQFPPPSHVLSSRTQYPDSSSRQAPLHGGPVPSNPTHLHSPPENRKRPDYPQPGQQPRDPSPYQQPRVDPQRSANSQYAQFERVSSLPQPSVPLYSSEASPTSPVVHAPYSQPSNSSSSHHYTGPRPVPNPNVQPNNLSSNEWGYARQNAPQVPVAPRRSQDPLQPATGSYHQRQSQPSIVTATARPPTPTCIFPGCRHPVARTQANELTEYCGEDHMSAAISRLGIPKCTACHKYPRRVNSEYCGSPCEVWAAQQRQHQ